MLLTLSSRFHSMWHCFAKFKMSKMHANWNERMYKNRGCEGRKTYLFAGNAPPYCSRSDSGMSEIRNKSSGREEEVGYLFWQISYSKTHQSGIGDSPGQETRQSVDRSRSWLGITRVCTRRGFDLKQVDSSWVDSEHRIVRPRRSACYSQDCHRQSSTVKPTGPQCVKQ